MNFLGAGLEQGALRTSLGALPLDDRLRRLLERQDAPRELIVGIRPEDFEDAALTDERRTGLTCTATVDVRESVGSDVFVHFTEEGGPAGTAELAELAADSGRADTGMQGHRVVARLSPATRATEGEPLELWINTARIHVFDPATGTNLTRPEETDA